MSAVLVAAGPIAASPAGASTVGDSDGVLRNKSTGLCLDHSDLNGFIVTAACDGSPRQQWSYSRSTHTLRNTGTDNCLVTGNSSAMWLAPCTDRWGEHWGYTDDGRIHQLDWTVGCVKDSRDWPYTYWGGLCNGTDDEVWLRADA